MAVYFTFSKSDLEGMIRDSYFFTANALKLLYEAEDPLPVCSANSAVYSMKCKTYSKEYAGETLSTVSVHRKEHSDGICL